MMSAISQFDWREPLWLWLALFPWAVWALRALFAPSQTTYADPHLLPWARAQDRYGLELRRLWRPALWALAWLLFAAALSGPRVAESRHAQGEAHKPELMIVLDLSRSMTARDIAPSRLERAKLELIDLLARAEALRIGLVVYAGRAHLMVPPTEDKAVLRHYLGLLGHGMLPTEGSNLAAGLGSATSAFGSNDAPRALLLVTDGEIPADDADTVADRVGSLRSQGIALYALGMGTPEGTALLGPDGAWLREEGRAVESRLEQTRLKALTASGGGRYAEVSDTDSDWRRLYDDGIRALHVAGEGRDDDLTVWRELYAWFLIPAALLLLAIQGRPGRPRPATPSAVLAIVLTGAITGAPPAHAADEAVREQAHAAYVNEAYREAARLYGRVSGYAGRMGEASSRYRLEEYRKAIQLFTQATLDADSDAQRADALLNLANSHYRLEDYATAEQLYEDVLRYRPDHRAAAVNLEYAREMRARQERERAQGRDETGAARQGRGPRAVTPPEGSEVSEGNVRLAEEEPPPEENEPEAALPPDGTTPKGRALDASRPVVTEPLEFEDAGWEYAPTSSGRLLLRAQSLEVDERLLWKRIFETEEGFRAPVDNPKTLPELPPW